MQCLFIVNRGNYKLLISVYYHVYEREILGPGLLLIMDIILIQNNLPIT